MIATAITYFAIGCDSTMGWINYYFNNPQQKTKNNCLLIPI